jgi:hypothetical protein
VKHEYIIGFSADLKGFTVLLLLAIAGTALATSGIWMLKCRKSP